MSEPERWSDVPVGTVHDPGCNCWPHVSKEHFDALLQAGDALAERLAYTGLAMHYLHGDFGLWDECENVECRKDCAAAARWRKVVG